MGGGGAPGKGSLKSFPVPTVMEDEERDAADEAIHKDEDVSIKVGVGWGSQAAMGMGLGVALAG